MPDHIYFSFLNVLGNINFKEQNNNKVMTPFVYSTQFKKDNILVYF